MINQDLIMEPRQQAQAQSQADAQALGIKTILLHVQNDDTLDSRVQHALSLARGYSAHLSCLHVTPIEAYVAFDSFGGVFVMSDVIKALDEAEAALRARVEDDLRNEDISWDYEQVTGNVVSQITGRAALSDLVITGRTAHRDDFVGGGVRFLGDLLHRTRTPLFIPDDGNTPCDPTGPALIAWDGSYEAANTVRSALGMLAASSAVHVVQIEEEEKETAFPGTSLLEYLSRHGIHAELSVDFEEQMVRELIPDMLIARAVTVNASYLVMGGYNHTRIGEYLFGGVTRALISQSPLPIVMAH